MDVTEVLVDPRVVLVVEEVAERVADGRLLEQARRHLVQQRLERVVVVLVHERRPRRCVFFSFCAAPIPAKPPPRTRTRGRPLRSCGTGHEAKVRRPAGARSSRRDDWPQAVVSALGLQAMGVSDRCATSGVESVSGHGNNSHARGRAGSSQPDDAGLEPQVDPRLMSRGDPGCRSPAERGRPRRNRRSRRARRSSCSR